MNRKLVVGILLLCLESGFCQPLRELNVQPDCIKLCLEQARDCRGCVKKLTEERYSTPKALDLVYHKAHKELPEPETRIRHHHFLDRPPWAPGSVDMPHGPGQVLAEGKVHANCPAMRARTGAPALVVKMPYTVRFFRTGLIEFDCDWISDNYVFSKQIDHPVDSPWIRLPRSHMQIFTVGDSRADVWILNSGIYLDDHEFMASPSADPADKGGSTGNKWLALPLPHKISTAEWRIEQGILSSFQRISKNVNIPLQLNFTAIEGNRSFIEIKKGTQMLQYVPAVLPTLEIHEKPMPTDLEDYLVMLSKLHHGGDIRIKKDADVGAYDVMKSYQLKENPGYVQNHKTRNRKPKRTDL